MAKESTKEKTITRSIVFPVIGPVDGKWEDLREALKDAWAKSTSLANWAMRQLAINDVMRKHGDKKCPKMPAIYLYGLAKQTYPDWGAWEGCYQSANSVLRAAEKKYRQMRYKTIWTNECSLVNYRYPFPFPCHNASWSADLTGGVPTITMPLGGRRWTLRLKGGPEMYRQLATFKKLVTGQMKQGECFLYRVRATMGEHPQGVTQGSNGGGARVRYRVMARLTVSFVPDQTPAEHVGTLHIATAKDRFIETPGGLWVINADHVQRWVANHWRFLKRIADDTKHERRWPKRAKKNIRSYYDTRCGKHANRIKTFLGQAVSMIVRYAQRQGCCRIAYDDSERGYFPEGFAWSQFSTTLKSKCQECGITLVASGEVVDENQGIARELETT